MILIRTNHDSGTHYLFTACDPIITLAEEKGYKVIKLEGDEINLDTLKKRTQKSKPSLIFYNGHGSERSISDNMMKEFLDVSNSNLFQNTITYARACNCLVELGRKAVIYGCRAFIGYLTNFWLPRLDGYMSRPLQDPVAKPIIESSNIIMECLVNGKTVKESVTESKKLTQKYIIELIYSSDPYMNATLPSLVNNYSALSFHGDENAKSKTI